MTGPKLQILPEIMMWISGNDQECFNEFLKTHDLLIKAHYQLKKTGFGLTSYERFFGKWTRKSRFNLLINLI